MKTIYIVIHGIGRRTHSLYDNEESAKEMAERLRNEHGEYYEETLQSTCPKDDYWYIRRMDGDEDYSVTLWAIGPGGESFLYDERNDSFIGMINAHDYETALERFMDMIEQAAGENS